MKKSLIQLLAAGVLCWSAAMTMHYASAGGPEDFLGAGPKAHSAGEESSGARAEEGTHEGSPQLDSTPLINLYAIFYADNKVADGYTYKFKLFLDQPACDKFIKDGGDPTFVSTMLALRPLAAEFAAKHVGQTSTMKLVCGPKPPALGSQLPDTDK